MINFQLKYFYFTITLLITIVKPLFSQIPDFSKVPILHEGDSLNIVHLINENYLNEERFASVFSISKFHQKKWGTIRIKNELKVRKISDYLITKSLKEIPVEEYEVTFQTLAEKHWDAITEKNAIKKRKKFCDYLLRKGWESNLVYEKVKQLEHQ